MFCVPVEMRILASNKVYIHKELSDGHFFDLLFRCSRNGGPQSIPDLFFGVRAHAMLAVGASPSLMQKLAVAQCSSLEPIAVTPLIKIDT